MYTLMIVEDELLARLALKNTVEWEKYNIHEVLEAKDGLEALEKFKQKKPDILVVDINIPFLNGIELIKEIRKINTQVRIIILSCMEDFGYAQEAIKAGVSQYILKASMSIEEIETAIKSAIDEIQQANNKNIIKEPPVEEFKEKKAWLRRLLTGEKIEGFRKVIFKKPFLLAVFSVEFISTQEVLSQELLNRMNFVKNIISSAIEAEYSCYVLDLPGQQYVAFIELNNTNKEFIVDEIKQLLENAVQLIQKYTSSKVMVGASEIGINQNQIYEYFLLAKKRLGYLYFYDDVVSIGNDEEILNILPHIWDEYIKQLEKELSNIGITNVVAYMKEWPRYTINYLVEIQNYWIELINRIAVEWEIQKRQNIIELTFIYTERMRTCKNLMESIKLFQEFLTGLKHYQKENYLYSDMVEKAIEYAENNFDKPITLNDAAEYIPVSSNHLSMIFRKEYGINYTDFIIGLRINKAKILLETSNCKLFEIAELCGFNDHAYFTRTFKKHLGISPHDYRKKCREQRN